MSSSRQAREIITTTNNNTTTTTTATTTALGKGTRKSEAGKPSTNSVGEAELLNASIGKRNTSICEFSNSNFKQKTSSRRVRGVRSPVGGRIARREALVRLPQIKVMRQAYSTFFRRFRDFIIREDSSYNSSSTSSPWVYLFKSVFIRFHWLLLIYA